MTKAQKELRKFATHKRAQANAWFFKTGPGQYGYGDKFIGVTVPDVRVVAKAFADLDFSEINRLLQSAIHEDRLLGLVILTNQYQYKKTTSLQRQKIVSFYLKKKARINNWDLVDTSVHKILGAHCFHQDDASVIRKLCISKRHWDRRLAIVATAYYIGKRELDLTFELAEQLLLDTEDLMHKATGWMLREAGKKDADRLREFIKRFGKQMPRTMLRYSIEKFPPEERQRILADTRSA